MHQQVASLPILRPVFIVCLPNLSYCALISQLTFCMYHLVNSLSEIRMRFMIIFYNFLAFDVTFMDVY